MRAVSVLCCAFALGSVLHVHAQLTLQDAAVKLGATSILSALAQNGQDGVTDTFQGTILAPASGNKQIVGAQVSYHVLQAAIGGLDGAASMQLTMVPNHTVTIAGDSTNWYFFGDANEPFVRALKSECIRFNKAATLCKINRPMEIPTQSVYDVISKDTDLTTTTAILEAQPDLLEFVKNVNQSGTTLAPVNAAWDYYFKVTGKSLDTWKTSKEAFSVLNELVGDFDPRTRLPFNKNNTATNGQEAAALYMDNTDMGAFVFPTTVPDNRNDYVAEILVKDIPAGMSLVWKLDRVPIPVDSPTTGASSASANNGASGSSAAAAATTAAVSRFLMAGLAGAAFMAVLL